MEIILAKAAIKRLKTMDKPTRDRIRASIERLPAGDIKKLQGLSISYRLRVGDYRILFDMQGEHIDVTNILPRGSAYKDL